MTYIHVLCSQTITSWILPYTSYFWLDISWYESGYNIVHLIALHFWVRQLYIVRWRFQVTVSGIASLICPLDKQCNEQILSSRSDRNRNAKCTHKLMIYFIIITLVSVYMYLCYSVVIVFRCGKDAGYWVEHLTNIAVEINFYFALFFIDIFYVHSYKMYNFYVYLLTYILWSLFL